MDAQYQTLAQQYQGLADEALRDPTKLQSNTEKMKILNTRMAGLLDSAIADMTSAGASGDLARQRDKLIEKLRRIQRDYNGLLVNTDKVQTLRRIRGFQEEDWKGKLQLYIIFFAILAGVMFLIVLFKRQRVESANIAPMSAMSTPPLM
jgi:hypothetical protein